MYTLYIYDKEDGENLFVTHFNSIESLLQEVGKFERYVLPRLDLEGSFGVELEALIDEDVNYGQLTRLLGWFDEIVICPECDELAWKEEGVCEDCYQNGNVLQPFISYHL